MHGEAAILDFSRGIRSSVVAHWTADQQVEQVILHQGHDSYHTFSGTTWVNEMNLGMNHAPDAGSFTQPIELQSGAQPLHYSWPPF